MKRVQISTSIDAELKYKFDHATIDGETSLANVVRVGVEREVMRTTIVDVDEDVLKLARKFADAVPMAASGLAEEIQLICEHWLDGNFKPGEGRRRKR